jgi:hypothetical protein
VPWQAQAVPAADTINHHLTHDMRRKMLITFASLTLAAIAWTGCDKITGGGKLLITGGGIYESDVTLADFVGNNVTVAFNGQPGEDTESDWIGAKGQIQLVDHTAGIIFHGVIDETINSQYQQYSPNFVGYWGTGGRIKVGKDKFIDIDSFQFNVSAPPGVPPFVFLAVSVGDLTFLWEGTFERGNVTIHSE